METNYKKLIVWKKSITLVKEIYKITSRFPKEEIYGLTSQMRRSSLSIPSNIAEVHTRQTTKEFVQFLFIAKSSAAELETQCLVAHELTFITKESLVEIEKKLLEILKMLSSLIKRLQNLKR